MRCSRVPFTASRSSYSAGQRLAQPRRLQGQGRRPSLRCNAVAEVESDMEKRGELRKGPGGARRGVAATQRHLSLQPKVQDSLNRSCAWGSRRT